MKISKLWLVVAIIIIAIVFVCLFIFGPQFYVRWQEQRYLSKVEKLRDQYRQDQYGGATPEETLKMFISAFKAKDLELASKYFIPEKQEEYLNKMQNWVRLGKGEEIVKSLENSQIIGELKTESFMTNIGEIDSKGNIIHSVELYLNPYNKKWKLKNM